jgi:hypothetical protein
MLTTLCGSPEPDRPAQAHTRSHHDRPTAKTQRRRASTRSNTPSHTAACSTRLCKQRKAHFSPHPTSQPTWVDSMAPCGGGWLPAVLTAAISAATTRVCGAHTSQAMIQGCAHPSCCCMCDKSKSLMHHCMRRRLSGSQRQGAPDCAHSHTPSFSPTKGCPTVATPTAESSPRACPCPSFNHLITCVSLGSVQ